MGKKGKRAAKASQQPRPGKARRERAVALRDIEVRSTALIEKFENELRDKSIFSPIADKGDCDICFLPLPVEGKDSAVLECCCKQLCSACRGKLKGACPFCRTPLDFYKLSMSKGFASLEERARTKNTCAIMTLAQIYDPLEPGDPKIQDEIKTLTLLLEAAELGHSPAMVFLGNSFGDGKREFLRTDEDKGLRLLIIAAKLGAVDAHVQLGAYYCDKVFSQLGLLEATAQKIDLQFSMHYMMAINHLAFGAEAGKKVCIQTLKRLQGLLGASVPGLTEEEIAKVEEAFR